MASTLYQQIVNHSWFENRFAEYYRWYPKSLTIPTLPPTFGNGIVDGIYIHVPFCDELCKFCPFNKKKNDETLLDEYVESLTKEIQIYANQGVKGNLKFIYFGGGTPSTLNIVQFGRIFEAIHKNFQLEEDCEITLEAHPTHLYQDTVLNWRSLGINRVSSGIQSFSASNLVRLGATHTAQDSIRAVEVLSGLMDRAAIDLLYRCENQTTFDWQADLTYLDRYTNITHVSCYTLFLPNNTSQPDARVDVQMAIDANQYFQSRGFSHYASCATGGFDFALPGHECQYEVLHWQAPQVSYLALGPGALGYINDQLVANMHSIPRYKSMTAEGILPILSATKVTDIERRHRFFSLGVKTLNINLTNYVAQFGNQPKDDFGLEFSKLEELDLITIEDNILKFTDVGRYYVDQVSEVFWSKNQENVPHPETANLLSLERKITTRRS